MPHGISPRHPTRDRLSLSPDEVGQSQAPNQAPPSSPSLTLGQGLGSFPLGGDDQGTIAAFHVFGPVELILSAWGRGENMGNAWKCHEYCATQLLLASHLVLLSLVLEAMAMTQPSGCLACNLMAGRISKDQS